MPPEQIQNKSQTAHILRKDMAKETVKKVSSTLLRKSKGEKIANGDRVVVYYQGTLLYTYLHRTYITREPVVTCSACFRFTISGQP